MGTKLNNRRKNYFIDKKFQGRFIVKFCLLVILGTLISGFLLYFFSRSTTTTGFENSRLVLKSTSDFIFPVILISGAVVIVSIGIATILITLFTSHKISGPLYRLEHDLSDLKEGNLKTIFHLRKGDQLERLLEDLNELSLAFKGRLTEIKEIISKTETLLEEKSVAGDARDKAVKEKISQIKGLLSKFNT